MSQLNLEHKTIVKGTFWTIFGSVAIKLISFIYTIFIARLFPQETVGLFYLALSVIYLASILGDLGINDSIGRFIPYFMGKGEKNKAIATLNVSYLYVGSLALFISILLFAGADHIALFFDNPPLAEFIRYMSLFLVVSPFFGANASFLNGLKKFKLNQIINNIQNMLKLILILALFFFFGGGSLSITLSFVLSYVITTAISFIFVKKEIHLLHTEDIKPLNFKDSFSLFRDIVPFGLTVSLVASFWAIATYTDRIMLGYLLPKELAVSEISVYSISISLATLVTLFSGSMLGIFMPVISELFGQGKKEEMRKTSASALRWFVFLSAPITIMLIIFPYDILNIFYGSLYSSGALVLSIFSVGVFVRGLSSVHGALLASQRFVRVELYSALLATIVNVFLNLIFIPLYASNGAAIASALSFLSVSLMLNYYSKKLAGFSFSWQLLKPLLAVILSVSILFLLKPYLLGVISFVPSFPEIEGEILNLVIQKTYRLGTLGIMFAFSLLAYAVSLLVFRAIEEEDKFLMNAIINRIKRDFGLNKKLTVQ